MNRFIDKISKNKSAYTLNTRTLQYQPIKRSKKQIMQQCAVLLIVLLLFAVGVNKLYLNFFSTPKERLLHYENTMLSMQYSNMQKDLFKIQQDIDSLQQQDDIVYRALLGKEKVPEEIREAGSGGTHYEVNLNNLSDKQLVESTAKQLKQITNKIQIASCSYTEVLIAAKKSKERLQHIPAIMPISNKSLKRTGSGFGLRYHPILNITRMHEGLDFIAPFGTEIFATGDGFVKRKYRSTTFGNVIIIDHGFGYETYYAHLSQYKVKQGETVKRGQLLGLMGSTGLSSGVHLHYEVHLHGKEVDPVHYFYNDLSPQQYQEIIKRANAYSHSLD